MLEVSGEATPDEARPATWSQMRRSIWPSSVGGGAGGPASAPAPATSHAQAIRQGSAMARSPPGMRTGCRWPVRSKPARTAHQKLPAPDRSVVAVAGAVVDRSHRGAELAVLGQAGRQVGVVVLDPEGLDTLALERLARGEVVGMQIVGHHAPVRR